jgi:hypothetical protein
VWATYSAGLKEDDVEVDFGPQVREFTSSSMLQGVKEKKIEKYYYFYVSTSRHP